MAQKITRLRWNEPVSGSTEKVKSSRTQTTTDATPWNHRHLQQLSSQTHIKRVLGWWENEDTSIYDDLD